MTQMHIPASRISVNPASTIARLRRLVGPAHHGLLLAAVMLMTAGTAKASGSSMPWEGPLQSILESIQGPVARIVAVIIIIATGLALAFGDTSGGFRKLIQIVFGLSIAFAASSFFLSFFSFSGGAVE
ncbi:TrbC/VirB2 family protein [Stutzerimonas stutzeri]|uniref:TrbC/VirB2 family protein n=1 Tax=Stutzerimonas stutzeri TaxID=316 RepID=UPI00244BE85A|nr:TrbC/VirB2 family protein [Stutzerimonas stutzeri]MDH0059545.1 TrbC/VirB2 family protein [Stutzerimonas stutzeri]